MHENIDIYIFVFLDFCDKRIYKNLKKYQIHPKIVFVVQYNYNITSKFTLEYYKYIYLEYNNLVKVYNIIK